MTQNREYYELVDEQATIKLAQSLSTRIAAGSLIFLQGQLGAGKTFFCQALIRAFGYEGKILSPTYSLVQSYKITLSNTIAEAMQMHCQQIHHFDLYRLADPEELEFIGVRDYINSQDICLIEWPSKGGNMLPKPHIRIELDYLPENPQGRIAKILFTHGGENT